MGIATVIYLLDYDDDNKEVEEEEEEEEEDEEEEDEEDGEQEEEKLQGTRRQLFNMALILLEYNEI